MLRRLNAVPDRYMFSPNYSHHVVNGSDYSELTGRDDFTLGSLRIDSLEVMRGAFLCDSLRAKIMTPAMHEASGLTMCRLTS